MYNQLFYHWRSLILILLFDWYIDNWYYILYVSWYFFNDILILLFYYYPGGIGTYLAQAQAVAMMSASAATTTATAAAVAVAGMSVGTVDVTQVISTVTSILPWI